MSHYHIAPAFSSGCVANASDSHSFHTRTCSRRTFVQTAFLSIPAFSVSVSLQVPQASAHSHLHPTDHNHVAQLLRTQCSPFIKSLSLPDPQCQHLLLWRGSQSTSPPNFERCNPVPDLLNPNTYGQQGVTFFEHLEQYMKRTVPPAAQVLPSRSHIATGSRSVASQWGTPVTVWPIGEFTYAYWQRSALIYTAGDSVNQTFSHGKQLVIGHHLREAVLAGKEVMFDAPAFFELQEHLARQVITSLSP